MTNNIEVFDRIAAAVVMAGLVYCSVGLTGCAGGYELGGKLGVYRVDSKQDSSQTVVDNKPWSCYFTSCESATEVARNGR